MIRLSMRATISFLASHLQRRQQHYQVISRRFNILDPRITRNGKSDYLAVENAYL